MSEAISSTLGQNAERPSLGFFDVVIVGAGMAGASLSFELAPHLRVLLLETESQPGRARVVPSSKHLVVTLLSIRC